MKILNRVYPILVSITGLIAMVSCTELNVEVDYRAQEQRFFDIYMATNYPGLSPEPSGLYYLENKEGTGVMPGDSTWVLINHVAYTLPEDKVYATYIERVARDNRILDTTGALYGPFKTRNGLINEGFTEGLTKMREGGEATFLFTSDLGFGNHTTRNVDPYTSLKYEVVLVEVLGDDIEAYEAAKILAYTDTIFGVESIYDTINDATMYYVVDETTDGPPVAIDSTIQVAYKGYLTDGRVFDQSTEGNYFEFKVGDYDAETTAIKGWHLGLEKFKEGEKGRLILPYQLAYGTYGQYTSAGNVAIPPYETLVFDVEVFSVYPEGDTLRPSR